MDNVFHVVSVGIVLIGAFPFLREVAFDGRPLLQVSLADETKGTDDGQGKTIHLKDGLHGRELSLEGKVHQGGLDEIVAMVTKCELVAPELLRQVKKFLATVPRAEKTRVEREFTETGRDQIMQGFMIM